LNAKGGEESKIAERQRKKCVRDGVWWREEVVSVVKQTLEENVMGEISEGLKG
jgi:hypothetical protein